MCASRATQIRISKEIQLIGTSSSYKIKVEDTLIWNCVLFGPPHTPYEGGEFEFILTFPIEYPFSAPSIKFKTKLFHPNISETGEICLGLLKDWKAQYTVKLLLEGVVSLLILPN